MNQGILNELQACSVQKLDSLNVRFSDTVQFYFNETLENAVVKMEREGRMGRNDIALAKRNFDQFIENLAAHREQETGRQDVITHLDVNESKTIVPLLWPIS